MIARLSKLYKILSSVTTLLRAARSGLDGQLGVGRIRRLRDGILFDSDEGRSLEAQFPGFDFRFGRIPRSKLFSR